MFNPIKIRAGVISSIYAVFMTALAGCAQQASGNEGDSATHYPDTATDSVWDTADSATSPITDSETTQIVQTVLFEKNVDGQTGNESTLQMIEGGDVREGGVYPDNNTIKTIDEQTGLYIHADASVFSGKGYAVEFELSLENSIDMSSEDVTVSFDVYLPEALRPYDPSVQFGFLTSGSSREIYSRPFPMPSAPGWFNVTGTVGLPPAGDIQTATVGMTPATWIFTSMRILVICVGADTGENQELSYYVNHIRITERE
jgi:hypothetical protein